MKSHYQTPKYSYNCVTGEGLDKLDLKRLESAAKDHGMKNKHKEASLRRWYMEFIKRFPCNECKEGQ